MRRNVAVPIVAVVLLSILIGACKTQAPATVSPPTAVPTKVVPTTAPPTAAPPKIFKIGLEAAFTGPSARIGDEIEAAATLAFDHINWMIGDYKVEMIKIDNESDPVKGALAYEQAIVRDGIVAGLSNWHSSVAVAEMEVVAKYKVPHFFGTGGTDLINEKYRSDPEKYKYYMVGKIWPSPGKLSQAYPVALDEAIKAGLWTPTVKKFAVWGEDTDWGRSFSKALSAQLAEYGWERTSENFFRLDEVDFLPMLNRVKAEGVQLFVGTATSPTSFAALLKQCKDVDLQAIVIADGLGYLGEWYSLTGDAADYDLDQIPQWTTAEAIAFRDEFKQRFGFEPSTATGGIVYDTANFFIKAARQALSDYGELTADTMFKISEKIAQGELVFTRADGAIVMDRYRYAPDTIPDPVVGAGDFTFPVLQYFSGQGVIIWPSNWKTGDLKVPW